MSWEVQLSERPHLLVIYEATLTATHNAWALLRFTAILYDSATPIFVKEGDHLGMSPSTESFIAGLRCGGRGSPDRTRVQARYYGDGDGAQAVPRRESVLVVGECYVRAPPPHQSQRHVEISLHDENAQQIFPLHLCRIELATHRLAICAGAVFGWSGASLLEWIKYHRWYGVEHFYIYDRDDAESEPD